MIYNKEGMSFDIPSFVFTYCVKIIGYVNIYIGYILLVSNENFKKVIEKSI